MMAYGFDLVHFAVFAAITLLLSRTLSSRKRMLWALIVSIIFAVLVELIQPLLGRERSACDLQLGLMGSVFAFCILSLRKASRGGRYALGGAAGLLLAMAVLPLVQIHADERRASVEFPLLASFESDAELGRWEIHSADAERVRDHSSAGAYSLRLEPVEGAEYPGLFLKDVPRNWLEYGELQMSVYLEAGGPERLWVRIDDQRGPDYQDRFQIPIEIRPGSNRVQVSAENYGRTSGGRDLDLANIQSFGVFLENTLPETIIYLDDVRLFPVGE